MSVLGRDLIRSDVFICERSYAQVRCRALLQDLANDELGAADARVVDGAGVLVIEQIAVGAVTEQKLSGLSAAKQNRTEQRMSSETRLSAQAQLMPQMD